jgi:hypothetical protein
LNKGGNDEMTVFSSFSSLPLFHVSLFPAPASQFWSFGFWSLGFVSSFGFRALFLFRGSSLFKGVAYPAGTLAAIFKAASGKERPRMRYRWNV